MPLDEASRRFVFLLQRDVRRLAGQPEEHASRGEAMRFDSASRMATIETRRGETVRRLYGEVLATYAPRDRILRWAWAGRAPSAPATHADLVFREGQERGIPQLSMSVVGDLDPAEALLLVQLGALVAGAEDIHERQLGAEIELVGLFERPGPAPAEPAAESRFSVPPPPGVGAPGGASWSNLGAAGTSSKAASPSPRAARTPATPRAASGPAPRSVHEPSRALFLPVANAALAALTRASKGYLQGLFVVTLDAEARAEEPRRLVVQLVVVDAAGILRDLDPPPEVLEAAASMVEADRREGNTSWRKLAARITPKPDGGATLRVDVM